ncbi:putative N-formylglutamate amidohydrolase [Rhizobium sp. BK077]|uniref:N-formylglutamate amidohydrolase n=1 Tax=unclassified Rhizobium TaxID=2613769 RepID=UPI0016176179|nr:MULTISPECIES: N-formylglutamate amidohydrolase [unclassified Rhizobium]MBB3302224.1 putative N-formylglutamate amidohydrolase [Rhizobium sp. BK112]MBB3371346.1 putative N-formylglutamate amidohydrolase [Rhizobium sp. BK077]MBB4182166.1 putative N-formylglutamate amidohydrolase [Rhizobium sp. BK109]MBB4255595.1 putative N-formylglutamate amidohydrolase [Rhizobium sp. BK008]
MQEYQLLSPAESPVAIENAAGSGDIVIICEHASRAIPAKLGDLGLDAAALESHIAWDPGALELSRCLSASLDACLYVQRFSRLVYDCNRPPEAPSAMIEKSEIYDVPGNKNIAPTERQARVDEIYLPFRDGLSSLLSSRAAAGRHSVLVTVHSYTPVYFGKKRDVEIGILHDSDSRLADAMLSEAQSRHQEFLILRNQPYSPVDGVTHTLVEHAIARGLPNVMIEVRNDLLTDSQRLPQVAAYLSSLIEAAVNAVRPERENEAILASALIAAEAAIKA